ncbi:MAG: hypothetical protein KTR33_00760 [Gammaproteobacteria bacterium]|nr:hypothetical protein [Gammaproteobacteria bacterium]
MSGEVVRLDSANEALKTYFLSWQCRLRQIIMREHEGRPDNSIMPDVYLPDSDEALGSIITLICKLPEHSKVPELRHMVRKTHDPAQRRTTALTLLSETYYQRANEFSDVLTSTFAPNSSGAAALRRAGHCRLRFEAFQQQFDLQCKIWRLSEHNPLWQGTYWHNLLFNPNLPRDTLIVGFEPDWSRSDANPMPGQ